MPARSPLYDVYNSYMLTDLAVTYMYMYVLIHDMYVLYMYVLTMINTVLIL